MLVAVATFKANTASASLTFWQNTVVTGKILDENGQSLPGASVTIKNTTIGTTTGIDGSYSLTIPTQYNNGTLIFSFIGYLNQEVAINGRTEININLEPDQKSLDEVVVVGYGTQAKRDITGSIVSVSSKDIEKRQPISVLDALQGQVAGLQISTESGRPGAGSSVRIRGTATLQGGAEPLYIVDGAQGVNIDGINPNDIESIEVLKDGASAAIYGSRSANGVIIITTKRGKEGKPRITASYLQSFSNLANKLPQANAEQRRLYDFKLGRNSDISIDSLNPSFNADNDSQDLLTRTAVRNQADLSVSGGSKQINYYGSFGYLRDEGIVINSYANVVRARFNMDYRPSDKFTYSNRIQFSYQEENRINEGLTLNQAIARPPTFRIFFPDGTLAPTIGGRRNPVAQALLRINDYDIYNTNIFNSFSYDFTKSLKFTTDANLRFGYTKNLNFEPKLLSNNLQDNSGSDNASLRTYWQLQSYFNYEKTVAKNHKFTGVLGVAADKDFRKENDFDGTNYLSETVLTLNSAQLLSLGNASESANTSASLFGRIGYNYKGRYLFNSNFRYDGASRFGVDNRWGFFPSASVGWRFSDEKFMNWTDSFLEDAKLRASYGITGNDRIDNYAAIQRYVFGQNYYNDISGVVQNSQFGNNTLSWESTEQLDIGTDLSFFNGRLNFTADYYIKTTKDLLYDAPLPSEYGFNSVQVNIGSIKNKGFEFIINGSPIKNNAFQWDVSYNMSFNTNTIEQLYEGIPLLPGNGKWKLEEGEKLGNFFGWKALGVYQFDVSNSYSSDWERLTPVGVAEDGKTAESFTLNGVPYTGSVQQLATNGNILKGGDVIWLNPNSDGVIDDADKIILGNAQPKFIAGFFNSFSYKNYGLSFNFYSSWGAKIYNAARLDLNTFNTTNVTPEVDAIVKAWYQQGDVTVWPKAQRNNPAENVREVNSNYIEDASFIRLRNLKLSYTLPTKHISKLKLQNVGLYVYGTNLVTWTNYKWYDPEIDFNNALQMGEDNGRYPREREFGLGLNVNF
ncbi:MAG TPA: TonB-dependent receptor [Pelobium sp.]|nr:TonB-dependent receptor [Pelobium sp.]